MICYDVEFQSFLVSADQGMNILFVQQILKMDTLVWSIVRKRELKTNVMWLLPVVLVTYKVNNMDIQYAQAAVYTVWFCIPNGGKQKLKHTEMTLIVDVDINLLKELHEHGSVNTMKDRRHDLYSLKQMK
jgi:predicted amidohydrolase